MQERKLVTPELIEEILFFNSTKYGQFIQKIEKEEKQNYNQNGIISPYIMEYFLHQIIARRNKLDTDFLVTTEDFLQSPTKPKFFEDFKTNSKKNFFILRNYNNRWIAIIIENLSDSLFNLRDNVKGKSKKLNFKILITEDLIKKKDYLINSTLEMLFNCLEKNQKLFRKKSIFNEVKYSIFKSRFLVKKNVDELIHGAVSSSGKFILDFILGLMCYQKGTKQFLKDIFTQKDIELTSDINLKKEFQENISDKKTQKSNSSENEIINKENQSKIIQNYCKNILNKEDQSKIIQNYCKNILNKENQSKIIQNFCKNNILDESSPQCKKKMQILIDDEPENEEIILKSHKKRFISNDSMSNNYEDDKSQGTTLKKDNKQNLSNLQINKIQPSINNYLENSKRMNRKSNELNQTSDLSKGIDSIDNLQDNNINKLFVYENVENDNNEDIMLSSETSKIITDLERNKYLSKIDNLNSKIIQIFCRKIISKIDMLEIDSSKNRISRKKYSKTNLNSHRSKTSSGSLSDRDYQTQIRNLSNQISIEKKLLLDKINKIKLALIHSYCKYLFNYFKQKKALLLKLDNFASQLKKIFSRNIFNKILGKSNLSNKLQKFYSNLCHYIKKQTFNKFKKLKRKKKIKFQDDIKIEPKNELKLKYPEVKRKIQSSKNLLTVNAKNKYFFTEINFDRNELKDEGFNGSIDDIIGVINQLVKINRVKYDLTKSTIVKSKRSSKGLTTDKEKLSQSVEMPKTNYLDKKEKNKNTKNNKIIDPNSSINIEKNDFINNKTTNENMKSGEIDNERGEKKEETPEEKNSKIIQKFVKKIHTKITNSHTRIISRPRINLSLQDQDDNEIVETIDIIIPLEKLKDITKFNNLFIDNNKNDINDKLKLRKQSTQSVKSKKLVRLNSKNDLEQTPHIKSPINKKRSFKLNGKGSKKDSIPAINLIETEKDKETNNSKEEEELELKNNINKILLTNSNELSSFMINNTNHNINVDSVNFSDLSCDSKARCSKYDTEITTSIDEVKPFKTNLVKNKNNNLNKNINNDDSNTNTITVQNSSNGFIKNSDILNNEGNISQNNKININDGKESETSDRNSVSKDNINNSNYDDTNRKNFKKVQNTKIETKRNNRYQKVNKN